MLVYCAGMFRHVGKTGRGVWFYSYLLFMKAAATACSSARRFPEEPVWSHNLSGKASEAQG